MDQFKINGTFVSEKISKILWQPEQYQQESMYFLTGSWNSSNHNSLKSWKVMHSDKNSSNDENEFVPKCCANIPIDGDVYGLEFVNGNTIAVGTSDGCVRLINLNRNAVKDNLTEKYKFNNIHKFNATNVNAPCNGISVFESDIATVGEDGRLNVLSANKCTVIQSIQDADSCSMTCVSFINNKELLTGNRMGIIKMYDVRLNAEVVNNFVISCEDDKRSNYVTCLTYHPTQQHIVLSGSEEGSITVWDLRQLSYPASYFSAHEHSITDINFHRTEPTKLFTASESGELFEWSYSLGQINLNTTSDLDNINPWLCGERTKNLIKWTPIIQGINKSINTFDTTGTKIICGCDNEAIYLIENLY